MDCDGSRDVDRIICRRAKENRKRPTDAEAKLWRHLRNRGLNGHKFRRQQKIGEYIVDFICLERNLIVELDGGQHNFPEQAAQDAQRTATLNGFGHRVLRFWNTEALLETEAVLQVILDALGSHADV